MRQEVSRSALGRWLVAATVAVSLGMLAGPGSVSGQTDNRQESIAGSVTYQDGRPAEGVTVDLFAGSNGLRENFLLATQTDAQGRYRFAVQPDDYILTFIAPGDERFVGGSQWWQPDVPVRAGQTIDDVNATLIGNVSQNLIGGTVTSGDGSAFAGLTIDLFTTQADGSRGLFLGDTTTDRAGDFQFSPAQGGCYTLTFIAPPNRTFVSGRPWYQPLVCVSGTTVLGIDAQLAGGPNPPVPTAPTAPPTSSPPPPGGPSTVPLPTSTPPITGGPSTTAIPTTTTQPGTTVRPTTTSTFPTPTTQTPTTAQPTTTTATEPQPPACQERSRCRHPMVDDAAHQLDVLSIRYLPDTNNDGIIDFETTGYRGTVESLFGRIQDVETEGLWWNTEATRPMGSINSGVVPEIGFRRVRTVAVTDAVPVGKPYRTAFRPDYDVILLGVLAEQTGRQICQHVDAGIQEVWIWTQHTDVIEPAESILSSRKIGDVSNSERTLGLPQCDRPYTVYNYNFTRGAAEMLHNRGHQAEALIRHHQAGGRPDPIGAAFEENCGNVHFPPNALEDYDYVNPVAVQSTCDGWRDNSGAVTPYDCSTHFRWTYGDPACFGDGGLAYSVWWFQHFPAEENGSLAGETVGNWWNLFSDLHDVGDPPGRQPQPRNWLR